ncbi:discoidin domain-containing protein [Polymorphospora sp. NPDC051019]|uniref:discoidin domain-containing protein n=1 Tax=Polymorphospora sp. NPDC051019 TaxID=3155725 RepID=UPI00342F8A00
MNPPIVVPGRRGGSRSGLLRRLAFPVAATLCLALVAGPAHAGVPSKQGKPTETAASSVDAMIEARLQALILPLLTAAQNTMLQVLIRDIAGRQFDGDTNALLSSVISEAEESYIVHPQDQNWLHLKNGVAQFQNISGFAYPPQIYIPNLDEWVPPASTPTVAVAPADQTATSTPGYQFQNGQVVTLPTPLTEAYAETNEVWVLSVNEVVDTGGGTTVASWTPPAEEASDGVVGPVAGADAGATGAGAGTQAACNPTGLRNNRGQEHLHRFKVPSPSSLGGLFEGKLEMKLIVVAQGGAHVKTIYFGKIKKKHITGWQYPDHFLTTWDYAAYGPVWGYQWVEVDGGPNINITLNIKVIGSVTLAFQSRDDPAGDAPVWNNESTYLQYSTGLVDFGVCSVGGDGGTGHDNLARSGTVSASSTFSGYSVNRINDGSTNTTLGGLHSWANAGGTYPPLTPEWVQVDFGVNKAVSRVVVYTSQGYPIRDFDIQVWNGITFITVAQVTGNTQLVRTVTFGQRTTRLVRLLGKHGPTHQPGYVRVNEFEAYPV